MVREFAVPITCKGKISAQTAHGGDDIPKPNVSKYKMRPTNAIIPPKSCPAFYKNMPADITSIHRAMNGNVRSITYRLPSLSINKIERIDPIAFVVDSGTFKIKAVRSSE